jgi:hypothetical protein
MPKSIFSQSSSVNYIIQWPFVKLASHCFTESSQWPLPCPYNGDKRIWLFGWYNPKVYLKFPLEHFFLNVNVWEGNMTSMGEGCLLGFFYKYFNFLISKGLAKNNNFTLNFGNFEKKFKTFCCHKAKLCPKKYWTFYNTKSHSNHF